jgi:hypothetical protein
MFKKNLVETKKIVKGLNLKSVNNNPFCSTKNLFLVANSKDCAHQKAAIKTKQDLNNILKSIQNFCNKEQKKLIDEYLSKEFFTNNENYNKYLTYFPSPIPQNSLSSLDYKFIKEWNYKKNFPLTPESFTKFSGEKVWWICPKKHEWKTVIASRTSKNGHNCPYCSGQKVSKENNLKFLFPKVAEEWHPIKNGNLTPEDVTKYSNKKVWWKCLKEHEWIAIINLRTRGSKCPKCKKISS